MDSPEEFSLEAMQELINDAQETIRSVRLSLRLRDPSIELPAIENNETDDDPEPREEESNSNTHNESAQDDSDNSQVCVNPRDTENNRTAANCEVREAVPNDISPEGAQGPQAEDNEISRDSEDYPIPLETFAVPEASGASGGNSCTDGDVILVSVTRNTNPVVIDLCSPDVSNIPCDASCQNSDVPTGRRRRRRRDEISSIEIVEDRPSPEKVASVDNYPFKCTICMESMKNRNPYSTICGHVFCHTCIASAIRFSKRCPICRKGLTPKAIHPIFF